MKKILSILLALILALSLFGCRQADSQTPTEPSLPQLSQTEPATSAPETTVPDTTVPDTTIPDVTEPESSEPAPTDPPATQKPTDPPATEKPTDPPATEKPTDPPATEKPTDPPATQKPTDSPATEGPSKSQQIVDAAFDLPSGDQLSGSVTLTGKVTSVTEVSEYYGNATFKIQVEGSDGKKTLLCYRVEPADSNAMDVAVGDTVKLTGTIQNYKGTIEFYPATYTNLSYDGSQDVTEPPSTGGSSGVIDKNGIYDSKNEVALYLRTYGCLPSNYITKSQAKSQGYPKDKCCGGDRFYNNEGLLPETGSRRYYECDIDTLGKGKNRGTKRIVYSNDGLIYYTSDHYKSFTLLYGTP